jgi:hypothetical protein
LSRSLLELADWLRCERVELVAMEATSSYWKPVFYLLEAEGFTCWLLNCPVTDISAWRGASDLGGPTSMANDQAVGCRRSWPVSVSDGDRVS